VEGLAAEEEEGYVSGTAWTMMLVTWAVICFYAGKFFLKVLRTPPKPDDE
jgi:hypothetical protein